MIWDVSHDMAMGKGGGLSVLTYLHRSWCSQPVSLFVIWLVGWALCRPVCWMDW